MVDFQPDVELPDDVFVCNAPVSTAWHDEQRRERAGDSWLRSQSLPVPRWWPRGVGHMVGWGDPETGSFAVDLEVEGHPMLARWPRETSPPRRWVVRVEEMHVHRWSDDEWEWGLAVTEPLSDEELAKVIGSMPQP